MLALEKFILKIIGKKEATKKKDKGEAGAEPAEMVPKPLGDVDFQTLGMDIDALKKELGALEAQRQANTNEIREKLLKGLGEKSREEVNLTIEMRDAKPQWGARNVNMPDIGIRQFVEKLGKTAELKIQKLNLQHQVEETFRRLDAENEKSGKVRAKMVTVRKEISRLSAIYNREAIRRDREKHLFKHFAWERMNDRTILDIFSNPRRGLVSLEDIEKLMGGTGEEAKCFEVEDGLYPALTHHTVAYSSNGLCLQIANPDEVRILKRDRAKFDVRKNEEVKFIIVYPHQKELEVTESKRRSCLDVEGNAGTIIGYQKAWEALQEKAREYQQKLLNEFNERGKALPEVKKAPAEKEMRKLLKVSETLEQGEGEYKEPAWDDNEQLIPFWDDEHIPASDESVFPEDSVLPETAKLKELRTVILTRTEDEKNGKLTEELRTEILRQIENNNEELAKIAEEIKLLMFQESK